MCTFLRLWPEECVYVCVSEHLITDVCVCVCLLCVLLNWNLNPFTFLCSCENTIQRTHSHTHSHTHSCPINTFFSVSLSFFLSPTNTFYTFSKCSPFPSVSPALCLFGNVAYSLAAVSRLPIERLFTWTAYFIKMSLYLCIRNANVNSC